MSLVYCFTKVFQYLPLKHGPWAGLQKERSREHFSSISLILNSDNIYKSINLPLAILSSKSILYLELFSLGKNRKNRLKKKRSEWGLEK